MFCDFCISQERLEGFLTLVEDVRARYQPWLFKERKCWDSDLRRDHSNDEAKEIHNAWMADVDFWMDQEHLETYRQLRGEADNHQEPYRMGWSEEAFQNLPGKHDGVKGHGKAHRHWKEKGAAKSAGEDKKRAHSSCKAGRVNANQEAHQLKKRTFNAYLKRVCGSKALRCILPLLGPGAFWRDG